MKKFLSLALVVVLLVSLSACVSANVPNEPVTPVEPSTPSAPATPETPAAPETPEPAERVSVRIAALKGPTGMGMSLLMDADEAGTSVNDYDFTLAAAPDEITGLIIGEKVDIAAVPTNLASVLYNKTEGRIQLLALNTLGVLSILEKGDTVRTVADLKGKTIYASGQGSTPEYALNYILKANGLDPEKDVTVEYKAEHAELATLMLSGKADIVLLPEPFVTNVMMKDNTVRRALDLTAEWDAAAKGESVLTMGCLIVSKQFANEHADALEAFLKEYQASVETVNAKPAEAADVIAKYEILASKEMAEKAIPNCNIVCVTGTNMKDKVLGFLALLFESQPSSVGGKLPGDDFYFGS